MHSWTRKADRVAEYLVCAIHISGGAPGRGTEVGVNSVINKPCGRRTLFFVGSECIIVPHYNKMRFLAVGSVRFLTRHPDDETTYLLKSYLLLVHHVVCIFRNQEDEKEAKRKAMETGNPGKWEVFLNTDIQDRRWTYLCADTMSPRRVATVMNKLFEEFQFPLSFSEYRQWQRGYAKHRGSKAIKIAMNLASGARKNSIDSTRPCLFSQGILCVKLWRRNKKEPTDLDDGLSSNTEAKSAAKRVVAADTRPNARKRSLCTERRPAITNS